MTILKTIPSWPDYFCSKSGEIFGNGEGRSPFKPLKQAPTKFGHMQVALYDRNKKIHKTQYVHRLVLETFIGKPENGYECRHLDGNPRNNHIRNLKWSTHSENMKDMVKHGTQFIQTISGEKHPRAKVKDSDVLKIREAIASGEKTSILAKRYSVNPMTIRFIAYGKVRKHLGGPIFKSLKERYEP